MATRTIVTSQPDVECEVCERRLLRGEQPDVFLAAGRRRIVCELCAPRATYAGWMRETDGQSLSLPPLRPRRGRSLFERLRQVARPASDARGDASGEQQAASFDLFADPSSPPPPSQAQAPVGAQPSPPFDAAQGEQAAASDIAWNASAHAPVAYVEVGSETGAGAHAGAGTEPPASHVEHSDEHRQALVVFNASEFPRRVAGLARSLGAPEVSVRSAEHHSSVVRIVIAWELCWYRYEVDLSELDVEVQAIGQGSELGELAREDRGANATAEESGKLALAPV